MLIYGIIKEKVRKHSRKVIHFRSYKTFDPVKYENLLMTAAWHVGSRRPGVLLEYNRARHCGRVLPPEE